MATSRAEAFADDVADVSRAVLVIKKQEQVGAGKQNNTATWCMVLVSARSTHDNSTISSCTDRERMQAEMRDRAWAARSGCAQRAHGAGAQTRGARRRVSDKVHRRSDGVMLLDLTFVFCQPGLGSLVSAAVAACRSTGIDRNVLTRTRARQRR
jgi:hypothetical protein